MTSPYPAAALAALVIVVINGALVPTGTPATLRDGKVVVPAALVARFADRVELADGTLTATRGERSCSAPVLDADAELVELAALARCLGARGVVWDARTKTVALTFGGPISLRSMAPFDPSSPQVSPTTVFTPEPSITPRVIDTGVPRPRRTPVPVTPISPSL